MARSGRGIVEKKALHDRRVAALINPNLCDGKILAALAKAYADNNPKGIQVNGFLDGSSYRSFLQQISSAKFRKSETRDMHSYFEAKSNELKFFSSNEFLDFAAAVTGKKPGKTECSLRMFMPGCYTLMHDEAKPKLEFYFDLTPEWNMRSGGAVNYVTEDGSTLAIPPSPNTLIIAEGSSYIKYVNSLAKKEGRLLVYGILS